MATYTCVVCGATREATASDLHAARHLQYDIVLVEPDILPAENDQQLMVLFGRTLCPACRPNLLERALQNIRPRSS